MEKKRLMPLLMTSILSLSLAGCGGSANTESANGSVNSDSTSTATANTDNGSEDSDTLQLWSYYEGTQLEVAKKMCDEYTKETGVKINFVGLPFGDFKSKLTIAATSGQLPDMVFIDNCDTVAYASTGIFNDLTDEFKDNEDLTKYYDAIMDTCYYDGKLYALPSDTNNLGFFYNKDLFDAAGIATPPTNWEELREDAKKLTKDGKYGFATVASATEEGTFYYLPWQLMAGGDYYTLDSEAGIKALTYYKELVNDGSMPTDCVGWSITDVNDQFYSQNVAIIQGGTYSLSDWMEGCPNELPFNWGSFTIKDKTAGSVFGGENLALPKGPNYEKALDFAKWWIQNDHIAKVDYDMGHFPAREDTLTNSLYQTPEWKPFIDYIPETTARPADISWPNISLGYQHAFQAVITNTETPEEAAKSGQAMIDQARNQ